MLDPLPDLQTQIREARARTPRADYPPALRRKVMAWARDRARQGWSQGQIAASLGLPGSTISRWKGRPAVGAAKLEADDTPPPLPDPSPSFRPVTVVTPTVPLLGESAPAGLILHTPTGYRVEGLDLDGLVAVLGRLG